MQKKKDNMLLLQQRFTKFVMENSLTVPAILLDAYAQLGFSEHELICLLKLFRAESGSAVAVSSAASICGISDAEAEELLGKWSEAGLLVTEENALDFTPLYNALFDFWMFSQMSGDAVPERKKPSTRPRSKNGQLIRAFEKEFARALSPMELEKLMKWVSDDKIPADIIAEALARASMQGKLSFAYIDRILQNWQREGFKSLDEINKNDKHKDEKTSAGKATRGVKSVQDSVYEKLMR